MTKLLDIFTSNNICSDFGDSILLRKEYENLQSFLSDYAYIQTTENYKLVLDKNTILTQITDDFDNDNDRKEFLLEALESENFHVDIRIKKEKIKKEYGVEGEIFINLDKFLDSENKSLFENLAENKINVNVIDSNIVDFQSDYLIIKNISRPDRKIKLSDKTLKEINFAHKQKIDLIKLPTVFTFYNSKNLQANTNKIIENFLTCVSDVYDKTYLIEGLKIVNISVSPVDKKIDLFQEKVEALNDLWQFLVDEQRFDDKMRFTKEAMAVHLPQEANYNDVLKIAFTLRQYVEKSFKSYVQNSVTLFVEQESQLMSTFDETSQKIYGLVEELTKRIRELLLGFIGVFLLTFIDKNHDIISKSIINISLLAYSLYGVFMVYIILNYNTQKDILISNLGRYESKVKDLVPKDMINEYQKSYIDKAKGNFKKIYIVSKFLTIIITSIFFWAYLANRFNIFPLILDVIKWLAYDKH